MSYAVRNDQRGYRAVSGPDDVVEGEYYSETEPVLAPGITPDVVDAERDRRIAAGFTFEGVLFQTERTIDRESIMGAVSTSLAAIVGGAKKGDLRWAGGDEDFFWIAADNSRVPMDAQTTQQFARGATEFRAKLMVACSTLKAMTPIPEDFTDDKWWP